MAVMSRGTQVRQWWVG